MFLHWVSNSQHFILTGLDFCYLTDMVPFLKEYFIAAQAKISREHQGHFYMESYFISHSFIIPWLLRQ